MAAAVASCASRVGSVNTLTLVRVVFAAVVSSAGRGRRGGVDGSACDVRRRGGVDGSACDVRRRGVTGLVVTGRF